VHANRGIFIFFSLLNIYFYKFFISTAVIRRLVRRDWNAESECTGFTQSAQILSTKAWSQEIKEAEAR